LDEVAGSGCPGELGEVVGGADQGPLGTHLLNAAQQELAEASCLFDLSEHRLHDLLPQPVPAAPSRPLELSSHGLRQRPAGPALVVGGVLGPSRGDVAGDAAILELLEVGLRAVARIGRGLFRLGAEVGLDPVDKDCELILVARCVSVCATITCASPSTAAWAL
jgi:hypothetical protein